MGEETWIEQQKKNKLFRGSGKGNDADRMLEISDTNRITNRNQAQAIIAGRTMDIILGFNCLDELCDMVELAQLVMDAQSRKDFMRVAIEQWQGKIQASKKTLEALL